MKETDLGICLYCKEELNKNDMEKHILTCNKPTQKINDDIYYLLVEGKYLPEYWLYLKVSSQTTLGELDSFLRDIWLECCGHLSCFIINKVRYASCPDYEFVSEEDMDYRIDSILKAGDSFLYEYDYGSTTELKLKVLAVKDGSRGKKVVDLIARNLPITFKCSNCKRIAEYTCSECSYPEETYFCEKCGVKHECGEEMLMPITNSPRSGVCGYTGKY